MSDTSFPVAISLHVFNRPDTTRKVFEEIRNLRPRQLFITADGPRSHVVDDSGMCSEVRSIVSNVDWNCDVHTNFSETNKGSFKSTSEGITWVFEHVDRVIILEDDCIPHESFFQYCHELLVLYENDERVALISGNDFLFGQYKTDYSYYFSRYTHMWGWATWKRTWDQVDFSMRHWPEFRDARGLDVLFKRRHEVEYWKGIMQDMYDGKRGPHWDYLLLLSMYMNSSLAIRPSCNLICNTGYGADATNFGDKGKIHEVKTTGVTLPLSHPPFMCRRLDVDEFVDAHEFSGGYKREIRRKVINVLPDRVILFLKKIRSKLRG